MSEIDKKKSTSRPKSSATTSLSEEDAEELRKLDEAYARIKKAVPDTPYFLTVPQDEPRYHHYSKQEAEAWLSGLGTMFSPHEEHLQYATFVYREQGDSCFVCRTAVDEERDRKARSGKTAIQDKKSFLQGSSNKKITLGSYLGKQSNGTSASPVPPNRNAREETRRDTAEKLGGHSKADSPHVNGNRETREALGVSSMDHAAKERGKDRLSDVKQRPVQKDNIGQKKPREEDREATKSEKSKKPAQEPLSKTARPSPTPESKKTSIERTSVNLSIPSTATPHNLPPLLSPINTINTTKYDLPPLLSPTLPPEIQQELDKLTKASSDQRRRGISDASSASEKRSRPVSRAENPSHFVSSKPKETVGKTETEISQPGADSKLVTVSSKTRERMMIKLKYGRKHRQSIERILKLPPRGAASSTEPKPDRSREAAPENPKTKDRAIKPSPEKSTLRREPAVKEEVLKEAKPSPTGNAKARQAPEKRPRPLDEANSIAPAVKRHKANSSIDMKNPRTPSQGASSSPGTSHPTSAQRNSQYLTPKKEGRALNMLRSSSDQGHDGSIGPSSLTPASASAKSDTRNGPTSAPSNKKAPDLGAWNLKSRKLTDFGRSLKHEVDSLVKKGKLNENDRKLCAARSLECIMAYTAGFTAGDYGNRAGNRPEASRPIWVTLLPLWKQFHTCCREFPHLEALCLHLGVVAYSRVVLHWAQKADQALHNGTDDVKDITKELVTNTKLQRHYALKAAQVLPLQTLMEQFPETWAGSEKQHGPVEWESLVPGNFDKNGPYWIHAGVETPPLSVVRFGIKFLGEWAKKQSDMKGYEAKLSL